ncbi:MAG: sensor histidine kinase [Chitinophagales bacterium]
MDIYEKRSRWYVSLLIAAMVITGASVLYSTYLASQFANEERKKMEILADSFEKRQNMLLLGPTCVNKLLECGLYDALDVLFTDMFNKNTTIPLILTPADEKDKIASHKNIDDDRDIKGEPEDSVFIYNKFEAMKANPPLEISYGFQDPETGEEFKQSVYVYYDESNMLTQLRIYPYVQLGIIGLFFVVAFLALNTARRSEQNKVWLGMAKETAHQIGTPLSSMVAWVELLKISDDPTGQTQMVGEELEKDVTRLTTIADRFSKIGSKPELRENDIIKFVGKTVDYVRIRASSRIKVSYETEGSKESFVHFNPLLFDWVIENLLKNALDAMGGEGAIDVRLKDEIKRVVIDISDTGKGIPSSNMKTVFEPGFSTKKRGWGLGLSLSKRIVENYHNGKIFVLKSEIGKGTTFRVILPKA